MKISSYAPDYEDDHGHVEDDILLASQVRILAEVSQREDELSKLDPEMRAFFSWNDYAPALCEDIVVSGVDDYDIDEDDIEAVRETWIELTHALDVDHHFPFVDLEEVLLAAENSAGDELTDADFEDLDNEDEE
jgi:hypothetical protein